MRLPVDSLLPDIVASLRATPNLVLEAPPGAGKTTRVPPVLLDAFDGEVLVLEPRRIAARLAARRVAAERGEPVGESIGYQVRFESVASARTRLRFLTEGVLNRRLISDPALNGVAAVVLDEFHERHLEGDLALALLRRLQQTKRPDLRLIVMSATLDGASVAAFLNNAPVLRSEGRLHPLEIIYTPSSARTLEDEIVAALENNSFEGDVLVFLPGAAEIRRAQRALEPLASRRNWLITPLHGDLSPDEQDRAVAPASQRKIILSTNVAESSITIDGVRGVIDCGLARVALDSPHSGLPRLEVRRISRSSAVQRAGRAGRTAPGRAVRLYTQEDFLRRPEQDAPEILRRELAHFCLELRAAGVSDPRNIDWLTPPPEAALLAAESLLERLRAKDRMLRQSLHPRLSRLVLDADDRGAGESGVAAAACLSAGDRLPPQTHATTPSDVLFLLARRPDPHTQKVQDQIRRMVKPRTGRGTDDALLKALLAAFPDRVARRRKGAELALAGGGSAQLASNSTVTAAEWLVALDIEERPDRGTPLVRLASSIQPEWLLELFADRIEEIDRTEWNRAAERVERISAMLYDGLALAETRAPAEDAALLARKALEFGIERFVEVDEFREFQARLAFAAPYLGWAEPDDAHLQAALETLCTGLKSFSELRRAIGGLAACLLDAVSAGQGHRLDSVAPERIRLPGGRNARVRYALGQTPWVASRLQDFFGMRETPRIAGGQVALVVHLLAPSQRPVQTTQDLSGFWSRLYPQIRRELMRKYPKHAWPEFPD